MVAITEVLKSTFLVLETILAQKSDSKLSPLEESFIHQPRGGRQSLFLYLSSFLYPHHDPDLTTRAIRLFGKLCQVSHQKNQDVLGVCPCSSIHAHPSMLIRPCSSIHAHPSMLIHPCSSIHAHPSMLIHPCSSIHAHPSVHAHPSMLIHPYMLIHTCSSIHAVYSTCVQIMCTCVDINIFHLQ